MTVEFLFLFSPNNSGSTIIGQYIESQTGGYLPPFGNNEGQMVPGVKAEMRAKPWQPGGEMNWSKIRKIWEDLAGDADKGLFIECSPPNIMRIDAIRTAFGDRARFLYSVASPYAFVASALYNYYRAPMSLTKITRLAQTWVERAGAVRAGIESDPKSPRITYETFCADPGIVNDALGLERRSVADFEGKSNEPMRRIVDLSRRHQAFLTFAEWDQVNRVLEAHTDLMDFFGYTLTPGEDLLADSAKSPALFHAGLLRRSRWETLEARGARKKKARKAKTE